VIWSSPHWSHAAQEDAMALDAHLAANVCHATTDARTRFPESRASVARSGINSNLIGGQALSPGFNILHGAR
jgi:hypothetical protein